MKSSNFPTKTKIAPTRVVIRFAGDSGDGIQLMGNQMTTQTAVSGNDIFTIADFPAEIRAPAGTLAGVSAFQLCFSSNEIYTAGDSLDTLVALNPAALKVNIDDLDKGGLLIIDEDKFTEKELKKAGYLENPLEDNSLSDYKVITIKITTLTENAVLEFGISHSAAKKCKNMFALGIVTHIYQQDPKITREFIQSKFAKNETTAKANEKAYNTGLNFADTIELLPTSNKIQKASLAPGTYTRVTGNNAFAYGALVAASIANTEVFAAGYPITPASDILNELVKYPDLGITAIQLEDEIAAITAAIGASFGGKLGLTFTSGPGLDLKSEGLGLAVSTELPLVVLDIQRAGPSTGMPTKMEQSDLLTAIFGRHGESPLVVLAPRSPSDCFNTIIEAFTIAIKYMTPVIVLSDAMLANSSEPWLLPDINDLNNINLNQPKNSNDKLLPFKRNDKTLARDWIIPGTKDMQHRVGSLEKEQDTGNVSYSPDNHQTMSHLRLNKINNIAQQFDKSEIIGNIGESLIISWGSTYGAAKTVVNDYLEHGKNLAWIHLRYLNPLPNDLKGIIDSSKRIIVIENNLGQLSKIIKMNFVRDVLELNKITGQAFKVSELKHSLDQLISG